MQAFSGSIRKYLRNRSFADFRRSRRTCERVARDCSGAVEVATARPRDRGRHRRGTRAMLGRCRVSRDHRDRPQSGDARTGRRAYAAAAGRVPAGRRDGPAVRRPNLRLVVIQFGVMFVPTSPRHCRSAARAATRRRADIQRLGSDRRRTSCRDDSGGHGEFVPDDPPMFLSAVHVRAISITPRLRIGTSSACVFAETSRNRPLAQRDRMAMIAVRVEATARPVARGGDEILAQRVPLDVPTDADQ